ncbi:unnamed protein product [Boreogadus saida]
MVKLQNQHSRGRGVEQAGCSYAGDGEASWTAPGVSSSLAGQQVPTPAAPLVPTPVAPLVPQAVRQTSQMALLRWQWQEKNDIPTPGDTGVHGEDPKNIIQQRKLCNKDEPDLIDDDDEDDAEDTAAAKDVNDDVIAMQSCPICGQDFAVDYLPTHAAWCDERY